MLSSISIKNFKSYRQAQFPLSSMTFLIGPNASGKSNALEAIRLLNWLAKGSRLDDIERTIQSGDSVVRGQSRDLFRIIDEPVELGCRLSHAPEGWNDFRLELVKSNDHLVIGGEIICKPDEKVPLYQVDGISNRVSDEISVAYNNFSKGKNKPHIPCSNRQAIFYQLETPGRFDKAHKKSQELIPETVRFLRENLRNIVFLDPNPSLMREYAYSKDNVIKEDGSNLSGVLYSLCQEGEGSKEELLNFVRSLPEQDITDIQFIETERLDVMVRLEESFGRTNRKVDAPLLSDGTLRVLAVAGALLSAPEGALVIIEEIDNGVHPSRAGILIRQIREIAEKRHLRVLLTSHNPALLDALPDERLEDVLCCYRDPKEGDSRLVRLGDLERYPELVAQGQLGYLMTRQILDRFLKDETTQEERKKNHLDWLATYSMTKDVTP